MSAIPMNFKLLDTYVNDLHNNFSDIIDPFTDETKKILGTAIPYISANGGKNLINPSTIGVNTFQKMYERDSTIATCLDYHTATMIESLGTYQQENKEIADHIKHVIKTLNNGFPDLIKKMITAFLYGFSVCEKCYDYDTHLESFKVSDVYLLPAMTILFQANNDGRTSSIFQYIINAVAPAFSNMLSYNLGYESDPSSSSGNYPIPIRTMTVNPIGLVNIDKDKIIHYTFTGLTGLENPYGVSILNRVYGLYLLKWGLIQAMATAFQRRAMPYTIVYADSQQELAFKNPYTGKVIRTVNAVDAAYEVFSNPNQTSVFIMPGKKDTLYNVEVVDATGNLEVFVNAIREIDGEMMRGMQVPDSIFNSNGGSYAMGSSQGSVFKTFSDVNRDSICNTLLLQFVKDNIELAFTEEEHKSDWGSFDNRVMSVEEKLQYSKLFKELTDTGIIKLEMDANQIREMFDLSQLEEKQLKEMQQVENQKNIKPMNQKDLDNSTGKPYAGATRESRGE